MKNSVDREICPRRWRDLPAGVERLHRGQKKMSKHGKEGKETGEITMRHYYIYITYLREYNYIT